MAPVKFGLFKARSRDHQEQPSTENLLDTSSRSDRASTPSSPVASTSKCFEDESVFAELSGTERDRDDEGGSQQEPVQRPNESKVEEPHGNYQRLSSEASIDLTTSSILDFDQSQCDQITKTCEDDLTLMDPNDHDDASTSCDANSIQFDEASLAPSEDISVYCGGTMKKPKKGRWKEEHLRDLDMWKASDVEVMQKLLSRSGTHAADRFKWEAIATARGLCTLTDTCSCGDCSTAKYLAGMADGDGGLGAAPLFSAINVGCVLQ